MLKIGNPVEIGSGPAAVILDLLQRREAVLQTIFKGKSHCSAVSGMGRRVCKPGKSEDLPGRKIDSPTKTQE